MIEQAALDRAAALWREARYVLVFTGAGISVPSGIPDFRSPGGLWERFDPYEVATAEAVERNPKRVWEFLLDGHGVFSAAKPNQAHLALAELEAAGKVGVIVTQNIDGLHQAAGSRNVIEYHGGMKRHYCNSCAKKADSPLVAAVYSGQHPIPPRCGCGGVIRPDVVFFGEAIPPKASLAAAEAANRADVCVIVGTSGEVAPASGLPWGVERNGGKVVEINLGKSTFGSLPAVRLWGGAETILPELARRIVEK